MSYKKMIHAVDTHSGEPMRVITGGMPHIPGETVYEQMIWLKQHKDEYRKLLLTEPRGYPPLCCNILVPPKHQDADMGYIILEQVEYPVMSGGNTIAVVTVLLETGIIDMVEPVTQLTLEAPAGLIKVTADCENGKVKKAKFQNVPAFAPYINKQINVPHLGSVTVDVGWGGMFYVIADVRQFDGLSISPDNAQEIARISAMIRQSAIEQLPVAHEDYENIGISISQLSGPSDNPEASWKNAVNMASGDLDWNNKSTWTGTIDRCPCGTGTCAKMATLYAKGELQLFEKFHHEGILGTIYTGELIEEVEINGYRGVIPTISGQAWITAFNTIVLDSTDPFPYGYTISDIWA